MRNCLFAILMLLLLSSLSYSQWQIQKSGVSVTLWDISFVDSLHGWAVGDRGTIIATNDGGRNWTRRIEPVDTVEFLRVKFVDRQTGFVGGNQIAQLPGRQSRQAIVL